ncbi:MAG: CoA-binding protein [Phaeospirillum sp.]|nr:CoA-binding protein [Phaeospirillum sp.]
MSDTSDEQIINILQTIKTIAVVGASPNPERAGHYVMAFLQARGYRTIPVNPGLEGRELLGERVYRDLASIPFAIDMVDVFRNSEAAGQVTDEAIVIGAKVVWMQLGVINAEAAARARAAGLQVVMDRCPKMEFSRLGRT